MNFDQLVFRLHDVFHPEDFDEHDGWDIAFAAGQRDELIARADPAFAATFNGVMG